MGFGKGCPGGRYRQGGGAHPWLLMDTFGDHKRTETGDNEGDL